MRRLARSLLETSHRELSSSQASPSTRDLYKCGVYIVKCFNNNSDQSVFAWFSQLLVKNRAEVLKTISRDTDWQFLIAKIVNLALDYILNNQDNVASSFRLLQVFTDSSSYDSSQSIIISNIFRYLVNNNYYGKVRQLVDARIPEVLEVTVKAPTAVSEEILLMIVRPLLILGQCHQDVSHQVLLHLSISILCPVLSDQIKMYILPSLAATNPPFPLINLIQSLLSSNTVPASLLSSSSMLFSFLTLSKSNLSSLPQHYHRQFLQVMSSLMSGVLSAGVNCDESISDPDDDDDDEMMMETDREVDDMIEECISIVNEKEVVAFIVELVETSDDPAVIKQVCIIAHHLLLHNNLAMYQYTLLYR